MLLAYRLGEPGIVKQLFFGIASFCTAASAVYLINDLLDLPSDRKHPIKQFRPLAAGWISALHALIAIPLLVALSLCFAWWVGRPAFFLVWVLYISLTTLYSLSLKKVYALDVLVLGVLYILRLFAGGRSESVV